MKRMLYLITLVAMVSFTSCQNEKEKPMNTLKIDFQEGDLPSLHPHSLIIYLRGISIAKTLYESLMRIDPQGKAQFAGAESVNISPDRLRYTFALRENHWSNGTLVTAFQYEKAWKAILSPTSTCSRADLLYMIKNAKEVKKGEVPLEEVGIKATDAKTLVVDLAHPSPYFLELVAQPICAPLIDSMQKEPSEFNGPFIVDGWKKGDYLRLKPNPYYWNKDKVSLKEIDVFMIQDTATAFSMYEKKELDWVGVPLCPLSVEQIQYLQKKNLLKEHTVDRAFWVFFNTEHPILSSPAIRKAFSFAVDRLAIVDHIFLGSKPLAKPIPVGLLPLQPTFSLKQDFQEAKKLFEQGMKELGLTRKTFPPIVISYSPQANRKQLAENLQEVWSKLFGIQVQLQGKEWNTFRVDLEKGLFEIGGAFEAAFYKDPMELLERLATINPCNFSQWKCPAYTEKLSLARHEKDQDKRMELLSEAEQILLEEMPFIPISSDKFLFAHHPNLKGYAIDFIGAIDFSYASF